MVTAGGDGLITILFWGVVFIIGAIASAAKKKRQEREVLETQEQLRRVDEAIRAARQRPQPPAAAPVIFEVVEEPDAAYAVAPVASQVLEVASPAFQSATFAGTPAAVPIAPSLPEEGPARPGAWEAARAAVPAKTKKPVRPPVEAGFAPPTPAELREAIIWREAFAPCKAMRSRPW